MQSYSLLLTKLIFFLIFHIVSNLLTQLNEYLYTPLFRFSTGFKTLLTSTLQKHETL